MASNLGRLSVFLELNSSRFSSGLQKAERSFASFGKRLNRLGRTLTTRVTLPLTLAGAAMIKASADLEAGLIGVQKTTGLADKEIKTLKKSILDFAKQNNVTISSLVETAQVAGQLGIEGSRSIQKFTETFAKLEIASDRTLKGELGARSFAKFIDLAGESIDEADNVASALVRLGNTSKTTEGRIIVLAEEIAAGTIQVGLGSQNILALATSLDEAGQEAERSRSALQTFFNEVTKAVGRGGDELQGFADIVGVTTTELGEMLRNDPTELLLRFAEGLEGLSDTEAVNVLEDLNLESKRVSLILQVLAERNDVVREKVEEANKAYADNTELAREAAAQNRGFNASLQRFLNTLTALGDAIAEAGILEFMGKGIDRMREWVDKLSKLNPEILKWGVGIAAAAAALGPLLLALSPIITSLALLAGPAGWITLTVVAFGLLGSTLRDETIPALRDARTAHENLQDVLRDTSASDEAVQSARDRARTALEAARAALVEARARVKASIIQDEAGLAGFIGGSKAQRQVSQLEGEINKLQFALDAMNEAARLSRRRFDDIGGTAKDINKQIEEMIKNNQDLFASTEAAGAAAKAAGVDWSILNLQINSVKESAREAAIRVGDIDAEAINAARATSEMEENMREFNEALAQTEKQLQDQQRIWDNLIDGVQDAWVGFFENVFQGRGIDSVKDFLNTVKDLFLRVIAEIAAAWTASKIFGGTFSLGNIPGLANLAGDGGILSGLGKIGAALGLKSGSGAETFALGPSAAKIAGTAVSSGGATGSLGASLHGGAQFGGGVNIAALGPALGAAAVIAMPFVARELFGGGQVEKILGRFQGFDERGPLGLGIGMGERGERTFFGGPNAGFAGDFLADQGLQTTPNFDRSLFAIAGDSEGIRRQLEEAEKAFEKLKALSVETFAEMKLGAGEAGQIIQDGIVDRAELARLGLENIGVWQQHAETGFVSLGDISTSQFGRLIAAVDGGRIRLEALRGEIGFNAAELELLDAIGLVTTENLSGGFDEATRGAQALAAAALEAASAVHSIPDSPRQDSDPAREIRRQNRRKQNTPPERPQGGGGK